MQKEPGTVRAWSGTGLGPTTGLPTRRPPREWGSAVVRSGFAVVGSLLAVAGRGNLLLAESTLELAVQPKDSVARPFEHSSYFSGPTFGFRFWN